MRVSHNKLFVISSLILGCFTSDVVVVNGQQEDDGATTTTATENSLPFTYLDETTELGYGVNDWNLVEKEQYQLDWNDYHKKANFDQNYCSWHPASDDDDDEDHTQAPIDIDDWDDCDDEVDDKHRWVTSMGNCEWRHTQFDIKPWGLQMTFPMSESDLKDPEDKPCKKPNFDSSGGYGARFFMNAMTIKTPSEHTIQGHRFDGEITMSLFRFTNNKDKGPPYTTSILLKSRESNPMNPVLQPFLDEWIKTHDTIYNDCLSRFDGDPTKGFGTLSPTISHVPTSSPSNNPTPSPTISFAPTLSETCEEIKTISTLNERTGGERTDHEGIMFDVINISENDDNDILINAFEVNVQETTTTKIQIYMTRGTFVGNERPAGPTNTGSSNNNGGEDVVPKAFGSWIDLGVYDVIGKGRNNPTLVELNPNLIPRLEVDERVAFYISQVDSNDNIQNIPYNEDDAGNTLIKDNHINIEIGMAVEYLPFSSELDKDYDYGRGFSGSIRYNVCSRRGGTNSTDTSTTSAVARDGGDERSLLRHRQLQDASPYFLGGADDPEKANSRLNIFELYPSPWYFRYRGSLTHPGCFDETRVRVVDRPLEISIEQLNTINQLISEMRDPNTCDYSTVGKPREDGSGYVNVNRPLQTRTRRHKLKYCNMRDWGPWNFWEDLQGNTCWCLKDKSCGSRNCDIDKWGNCESDNCDSHWWPRDKVWEKNDVDKSNYQIYDHSEEE